MLTLNLPTYAYKLAKKNGEIYIFDVIRKADLLLTSEEWVRQHFLNYLIHHLKFPQSLINVELGLKYNKRAKRADIMVYSATDGSPLVLVECKAPHIKIDEIVLQQIAVYYNTLKPKYLVLTNGIDHFYFRVESTLVPIESLPTYIELI